MCDTKYRKVKKVLWVILFANFLVAGIKIGVGVACKSQSVIADGIHSFADGSSNVVGLIGIWLAAKPVDEKHPYGHYKFEIMASLFIGVMLAVMSVRIVASAAASFGSPSAMKIGFVEMALMLLTIIINVIVASTEYRRGKRLGSTILVTDSLHTRGDIMISCAVLLGMLGIRMGLPLWVDGAITMLIAAAVLMSAWKIIKYCVDVLADSTVIGSEEVRQLVMSIPEVCDVHKVRSRGELNHACIDFHAVVSPKESVECMHSLSHTMESLLKERYGEQTEVCIHVEPDDGMHGERE